MVHCMDSLPHHVHIIILIFQREVSCALHHGSCIMNARFADNPTAARGIYTKKTKLLHSRVYLQKYVEQSLYPRPFPAT